MANFKTHVTAAGVVSGILASTIYSAGMADSREMMTYWIMGTLGGILPDVDSDNTDAMKIVFTLLASLVALVMLFSMTDGFALLELWIICGAALVVLRFGGSFAFAQFSVHRGTFHSIIAAVFFWLFTTACFGLKYEPFVAWMAGLFVFVGFIIHLSLDEMFSVNFMNEAMETKLGTSMKPFSMQQKGSSVLMLFATIGVGFLVPHPQPFIDVWADQETYLAIVDELIPNSGEFFGVEWPPVKVEITDNNTIEFVSPQITLPSFLTPGSNSNQ